MNDLYKKHLLHVLFSFLIFAVIPCTAQVGNWEETHRGAVYFSIGYDKQWFSPTSVHVNQGAQNNYSLSGFTGTDAGPANDFLSPMHYTFRLGCYFNYSQNAGLELSYSPIRYYIPDNQNLQITGTFLGQKVTDLVNFQRDRNFKYFLDNGSGSVVVNFVKRFGLFRKVSHKFSLDLMLKAGMGLITPKVTYGFGTTAVTETSEISSIEYNLEGGLRWTTHRHVFVEVDYHYQLANLNDLYIANGTISQQYNAQGVTGTLGYIFPVSKHNPLFSKGWPHRKEINHPKPMYHREEDY